MNHQASMVEYSGLSLCMYVYVCSCVTVEKIRCLSVWFVSFETHVKLYYILGTLVKILSWLSHLCFFFRAQCLKHHRRDKGTKIPAACSGQSSSRFDRPCLKETMWILYRRNTCCPSFTSAYMYIDICMHIHTWRALTHM